MHHRSLALLATVALYSRLAAALPPVYVTVISHNEEPLGGRPDYTADASFYLQNRSLLRTLATTITSRGAAFNFQSDWTYLKAVAAYDTGTVTSDTGGKNIVRWMHDALGVEVDPHAHETQYNYADVAYLIAQLGVTPSNNLGGFLYSPPDNSQGWDQHVNGISGALYPSYFWRADQLWGAATFLHQGNDDHSSGIWRPKDEANFYIDDPNQRLLYIGGCGDQPVLIQLLSDIESGRAPADGFYTATVFVVQDLMTEQSIAQLGAFIDSLAPMVAAGRVRWTTLTQMAQLWRTTHGSRPFRYDCTARAVATYETEATETFTTAPSGNRVYTRVVQPVAARYSGQRFPALIAIPGGTGAGAPLADNQAYRDLATSGLVVVAFNPEGRGTGLPGNLRSEGSDDCNGFRHQDDLKAVIEHVADLPNVDASNIGVETSSLGIAIGAGALGRYPTLPVRYLVDQEGPHDSRVITFYDAGHEVAVCGHLSTVTDTSAQNATFWSEREAVRYIGEYPGRYLRMQAEIDHAQNPGYFRHAIEMINAATRATAGGSGTALWTRMNGSDLGNAANTVYAFAAPASYPVWISGRIADHPALHIAYVKELAATATQLLSANKLQIADPAGNPAKRKVTLLSTDSTVTSPAPDDPNTPLVASAVLEIMNASTGERDSFSLPATNWKGIGRPAGARGYRYADSRLLVGPCRSVRISNGKRLEATCKGSAISFSLDEPSQGKLVVTLTFGGVSRYCMAFGGTIVKDVVGTFQSRNAAAPDACITTP